MSERITDKPIVDPDLYDAFVSLRLDIFRSMNCVKVGQITAFDGTKRTAQIQILFRRVIPDPNSPTGQSVTDYPLLVDCPVFTLQGGGGFIQFPVAAGDQCLVLFSDRNLDAWFLNGAAAAPFDGRAHDMSDGIALVGLNSLASTMAAYPTNKSLWSYSGSSAEIGGSGAKVKGTGSTEVDLISGIVTLKNGTTTLLTLLNGLIDVIAAATVQTSGTPPLTAATIAALQAYKLQLAVLLG